MIRSNERPIIEVRYHTTILDMASALARATTRQEECVLLDYRWTPSLVEYEL